MGSLHPRAVQSFVGLAALLVMAISPVMPAQAAIDNLTVYTDSGNNDKVMLQALAKAFENKNPDIHIALKVGPVGETSVKLVRQRLDAGKMEDVFIYFSGSLFQSLNPTKNLVNLTGEHWQSRVDPSFIPAVSVGARTYGAPIGSAMGGGILYNKSVYKRLSLKVPLTWSEFMQNNAKIKKAGIAPVIQTYGDSWTSQFFVLADEFNLQTASPNFPALYTAKKANYSSTPAAFAGFQHLEDIHKLGFENKDYATANLSKGLRYLVTGVGAQYPMFTAVATNISKDYPKLADRIGFFAIPGPSSAHNGLTVWMPDGLFISKSTSRLGAAKRFVAFAVSARGIAAIESAVPATGPYMVKGITSKTHFSNITLDFLRYINAAGKNAPALEYVSPIKGPNLPSITVKVGSGIMSAKAGAAAYDADVQKELRRLGLPGWGPLPN